MKFSQKLWQSIEASIFNKILKHPFVEGLASGKLEEKAFQHYVIQDSLYLKDFGRGLALLAARSETSNEFMQFCQHAQTTIIVEQALHESFLADWKLSAEAIAKIEAVPNCLLYTSYLLRVVHERPYYEALGAFLPCYWIYQEVGKALVKKGSPNPLYQRWIDTYAGEAFEKSVREILEAVDANCEKLNQEQQAKVQQHFLQCSRFEWMFWDMGYHHQNWPV